MESLPPELKVSFSDAELKEYLDLFNEFDIDGNGSITNIELDTAMRRIGEKPTKQQLQTLINEVDLDHSGTVEFNEFIWILDAVRRGKKSDSTGFARVVKQAQVNRLQSATGATHSFSDEEKEAFVEYINNALKTDPIVKKRLPINPSNMDVFKACRDGILLCKLINHSVPKTIDERVINTKEPLNTFHVTENNNLCINSAKAIGCNVVNIGWKDLAEGKEHLILGLLWQIIKIGLFAQINLANHPGLVRLLEPGETLADLLKLPPDQILLRWFNYHLRNANHPRRVHNFSSDIKDSECYQVLLHQIAPKECSPPNYQSTKDMTSRANFVLTNADKINCRKFVTARDIVKGNSKLNLAFVATIFNTCPALDPVEEVELPVETREEKQFRIWMNSLGIMPQVNYLYEDLKDGVVLLKVFDKVKPGIVDWRKVNVNQPLSVFKKVENCNYAVVLGKQLKFSLVGIGGKDITEGHKMFTLAIIWQLMRYHMVSLVKGLSKGGAEVTDRDILDWANAKVKSAGKGSAISSFRDPSLKDARFLIDLLAAVSPQSVNYEIVNTGISVDDRMLNANYAISVARKMGASIFALPEDIIEVKQKMILMFVGAIMALAQ